MSMERKRLKILWVFLVVLFLLLPNLVFSDNFQIYVTKKQIHGKNHDFLFETSKESEGKTILITNSELSLLTINSPDILYNWTHVTIANLTVSFINETDITQASAEDNVTIVIYNRIGFSKEYLMTYQNNSNKGWEIIIDVSYENGFDPRTYFVDLDVTTGEYYFSENIYTFKKYFEIWLENIHLFLNDENQTLVVQSTISTYPHDYRDYILLHNSEVYACIYNSSNFIMRIESMYCGGFIGFAYTWSTGYFNISNFHQGSYYALVTVVFDEDIYISNPSNTVIFTNNQNESSFDLFWLLGFFVVITLVRLSRIRKKQEYT